MDNELEQLKKLLSTKQGRINSMLELTKAVNSNFSKSGLLKLLEFILIDRFKVGKFVLFVYDVDWHIDINIGNTEVANKLDVASDLIKFEVIQDVRRYPTDLFKGFEYIIPIVHKRIPLAYLLVGDLRIDVLESLEDNLKFIETLSGFVIISLENTRLFKIKLEQEIISKELELAGQVQKMLIPTELPSNEFFDVASFYRPHGGIGGDYYDFIMLDESTVAFCICDVSGKGISAAMIMANFQAQLRSLLNKYDSLEQLVDHLNNKLFEITKGDRYITMFLGLYNINDKKLRYVSAGHNPTLLYSNGEIKALDSGCTILGAFQRLPKIVPGELVLDSDTMVFCYTDGVTELENDSGEQFGIDKLNQFLFKNAHLDVNEIIEKLKEAMEEFRGDTNYNDDVCLLLSRFH
jgi:sigma-B regulation protein RsbU (phosphoserine phosphatase)